MKKIVVLFLLISFLIPQTVLADGIIIPPPDQNITQAQQRALIVHQNGIEELIISLEFGGDAEEFAWFLPVPEKPEIKRGDDEIFTKLAELTKPKKNLLEKIKGERKYYGSIPFLGKGVVEVPEEEKVKVIETKRVGILEVTVLTATKAADLENWLKENGYQIRGGKVFREGEFKKPLSTKPIMPEGKTKTMLPEDIRVWPRPTPMLTINKTRQIFQEYLDKGWYFVAAKIATEFLKEYPKLTPPPPPKIPPLQTPIPLPSPPPPRYYGQAHITPLHLTFKTEKIVYPMKITSLSQDSPSVLLYVLSDHRKIVSNYKYQYVKEKGGEGDLIFKTKYAARISGQELKEWLPNAKGGFLTKLYTSYISPTQMKQDLRFENAKDQKSIRAGEMRGKDYLLVPLYILIYGPFRVLEWYFQGGRMPVSFQQALFLILLGFLGGAGLFWSVAFYFFLSRTTKRFIRVVLYFLQFPGVWLLVNCLSLLFVLPCYALLLLLKVEPAVMMFDLLLKNNLGAVFFTAIFYTLQSKVHLIFKKKR